MILPGGTTPPDPPAFFPGGTHPPGPPLEWQLRFDRGRQQRYLPDRASVLRYVLAVGPQAASPRFEVFAEAEPVRLADGSDGGRRFSLVELIDLDRPGEAERLRQELDDGP
jgi:hypothetical protein